MGIFESLLGDLVLLLMQQPLVRWGLALAASLWVWLIGDEDARLRRFYLLAPFLVAGFVEVSESLFSARGDRLTQLLAVQEAARRIVSLIGLGAIVLTMILGFMRGIGFALGVALLLSAYFVDSLGAKEGLRVLSGATISQVLMLLPTVLVVLLSAYGLGASFRRFRESRDQRAYRGDRD